LGKEGRGEYEIGLTWAAKGRVSASMAGLCAPSSARCLRFSERKARRIAALPASASAIVLRTRIQQQNRSPVVRQTSIKEETELHSKLKVSSHSRADFGGRGGRRRPRVSARAARFFGLRWKNLLGGEEDDDGEREREESENGVWAASWTRTRWVAWAGPKKRWALTDSKRDHGLRIKPNI